MTDTFAVLLAVAQFALTAGDNWFFARIPEWNQPTPDLLAVPSTGASWTLEVKGTAPLSFNLAHNARLDLCTRLYGRRSDAKRQLLATSLPPMGGTQVLYTQNGTHANPSFSNGGRALAIQAITDLGFANRGDLEHGRVRGCPQGSRRCIDVCLKGASSPVVGVLLGVPSAAPPRTVDPSSALTRRITAACVVGPHAVWARASGVADEAIHECADVLREASNQPEEFRIALGSLVGGLLQVTRGCSSIEARTEAVDAIVRYVPAWIDSNNERAQSNLRAEANFGLNESSRKPRSMRSLSSASDSPEPRGTEILVAAGDTTFAMNRVGSSLRVTPTLDSMRRLLSEKSHHVTESLLQALSLRLQRPFSATMVRTADSEGGSKTWEVGLSVEADRGTLGWISRDGRALIDETR